MQLCRVEHNRSIMQTSCQTLPIKPVYANWRLERGLCFFYANFLAFSKYSNKLIFQFYFQFEVRISNQLRLALNGWQYLASMVGDINITGNLSVTIFRLNFSTDIDRSAELYNEFLCKWTSGLSNELGCRSEWPTSRWELKTSYWTS